jgi:hypothetical protein
MPKLNHENSSCEYFTRGLYALTSGLGSRGGPGSYRFILRGALGLKLCCFYHATDIVAVDENISSCGEHIGLEALIHNRHNLFSPLGVLNQKLQYHLGVGLIGYRIDYPTTNADSN